MRKYAIVISGVVFSACSINKAYLNDNSIINPDSREWETIDWNDYGGCDLAVVLRGLRAYDDKNGYYLFSQDGRIMLSYTNLKGEKKICNALLQSTTYVQAMYKRGQDIFVFTDEKVISSNGIESFVGYRKKSKYIEIE